MRDGWKSQGMTSKHWRQIQLFKKLLPKVDISQDLDIKYTQQIMGLDIVLIYSPKRREITLSTHFAMIPVSSLWAEIWTLEERKWLSIKLLTLGMHLRTVASKTVFFIYFCAMVRATYESSSSSWSSSSSSSSSSSLSPS